MDVWVNFSHATRFQAEGIFKCFFPSKPSSNAASPLPSTTSDTSQKNLPLPKRKIPSHTIPLLEEAEISELAKRFADAIPEDELSVCLTLSSLLRYPSNLWDVRLLAFKVTFSRTRRDPVNAWMK
jgi:chaperone BCS1